MKKKAILIIFALAFISVTLAACADNEEEYSDALEAFHAAWGAAYDADWGGIHSLDELNLVSVNLTGTSFLEPHTMQNSDGLQQTVPVISGGTLHDCCGLDSSTGHFVWHTWAIELSYRFYPSWFGNPPRIIDFLVQDDTTQLEPFDHSIREVFPLRVNFDRNSGAFAFVAEGDFLGSAITHIYLTQEIPDSDNLLILRIRCSMDFWSEEASAILDELSNVFGIDLRVYLL